MSENERRVQDTLESLGAEARRVFEHGAPGEEWAEGRDTIEGCDAWYEWCSDCRTYHQSWYVPEYVVERGKLTIIVHSVDTDGDWACTDEIDVADDADMERYERDYGPDAWCRQYDEYVTHVAESGDDPCGEFLVAAATVEKQTWTVCVRDSTDGLVLAVVKLVGDAGWRFLADAPHEVRDYLCAARVEGVGWVCREIEDVARLCEVEGVAVRRSPGTDDTWEFDFDVEISTPRDAAEIATERRYRARGHLEQSRKRT